MGTVVAFRRHRIHRRSGSSEATPGALTGWTWHGVGAAAAATAAVLSALRWPARVGLVLVGAVGVIGVFSCFWLSSPTNWPMIRHAVAAFLGAVALWHGGEAALRGSRTAAAHSFAKARQRRAPGAGAE